MGVLIKVPRCTSSCPTNCLCNTWLGSWIPQFAKRSVAPNLPSSGGWMSARTGKSSVGVGCKQPMKMRKASFRMLSMRRVCVLRHQIGAQYSAGGVDQGKSRDAQCLGTCTSFGSRKSLQQRNSGEECFAQSLEVVTESERPIQLYPKIRWDWTGWQ